MFSQTRYIDEVFSNVTVTADTTYATNISVLTGTPMPEALQCDIYEPAGDTVAERPVVILGHTGTFLPAVFNGQPTGRRQDSAVVEICTRLAKSGYVAVAISNRLGWNPISPDQNVRTSTLINAAYRGVQDVHTCIRFFKANAANSGNGFKVDTNRMVVGGIGTGGYLSLASAFFDRTEELLLPKFINFDSIPPEPYIDTLLSGDFSGTVAAPLNIPNHLGPTSDFHMVFNIGGALGDSSWLEDGDIPSVSFHCIKDPLAPYMTGDVIEPVNGNFVIEASGSYVVAQRSNGFGNSQIFHDSDLSGPFTDAADVNNDGFEGLFPFDIPTPNDTSSCVAPNSHPHPDESSPWDWWNEAWYIATANAIGQPGTVVNCIALTGNPNDPARSKAYIDSILGYLQPRMVCALDLPGCIPATGIEEYVLSEVKIYPNPASTSVIIDLAELKTSVDIELYDVLGNLVYAVSGITDSKYTLQRKQLASGIYYLNVRAGDAAYSHKLLFN